MGASALAAVANKATATVVMMAEIFMVVSLG
jgi:hypothetical protein